MKRRFHFSISRTDFSYSRTPRIFMGNSACVALYSRKEKERILEQFIQAAGKQCPQNKEKDSVA